MSFKNIQEDVGKWTSQFEPQYWEPHQILARLMEEAGELAREINYRFGPKPKKPTEETRSIGEEIYDIIFTLCCLANSQRIDLDEAWQYIINKYSNRDYDRYERKQGL